MSDAIDGKAFHQFSYGLFLLASRVGDRDNACIINTAVQAASAPRQISIACIKGSCTQEMIDEAGIFSVSVLTESTPLAFFEHFGMQSGHDVNKFEQSDSADVPGANAGRCAGDLVFEPSANAYFSCKVVARQDIGSHVAYVGEVVEAKRLSDEPSITYDYYRKVTKKAGKAEQAAPATGDIVAWKCTVCGYIYEGAELPQDFVCPLCKHGAEDFEPVYGEGAPAASAAAAPSASSVIPPGLAKVFRWERAPVMTGVANVFPNSGNEVSAVLLPMNLVSTRSESRYSLAI